MDLERLERFEDSMGYTAYKGQRAFCPVESYALTSRDYLSDQFSEDIYVVLPEAGDDEPLQANVSSLMSRQNADTVGPTSSRNLSQRLEGIANALTNYGLRTTNDTVEGDATMEGSYVRIRWQWIVLLAFLEVASLALLILTMIHSRRKDVPLWKSSVLALIYHGVDELRGQETLAAERLSGMEVTAKTTDVQLVKSEDGLNTLSKRSGCRVVDQDG